MGDHNRAGAWLAAVAMFGAGTLAGSTVTDAPAYSVEYRAHVQSVGWQPWVKDGATAGTVGSGLRVEAVEIRIVPATEPTPAPTRSRTT